MTRKLSTYRTLLVAAALAFGAASHAQTPPWWDNAYSTRIPVTIANPSGGIQPTPNITAEVPFSPLPSEAREDFADIRVGYWNGSAWQQLDRQVLVDGVQGVFEFTSVGNTDYASLPTGTKLAALTGQDDAATVVDLPFAFPFRTETYSQITVATDGFIKLGAQNYGPRPDNEGAAGGNNMIIPFTSDFAVTDAAAGVWVDASPTQVVIRWEVNESASGPVIAKFAAILYPNGDIRFVYGSPASSPSAGIADPGTGYWPVRYGVGVGTLAQSIINTPAFPVNFANQADILYQTNQSDVPDGRVVFRLAQPLADGATSTGQYFIYYGNPSPVTPVPNDVYAIYDYVVDFADDTPGTLAQDWMTFTTDEQVRVVDWLGTNVGVLEYNQSGGFNHPQAIVKDGAMPKFLNQETYSRMAPYGGGQLEQAPILRVPQSPTNSYPDPNQAYGGGYGYATDAFGTWGNDVVTSYVNPIFGRGPGVISGFVQRRGHVNAYENIIFRVEGAGMMWGKAWRDTEEQPGWTYANVDRTALSGGDVPSHASTPDPIYNQPGGVGATGYAQAIGIQYIALRELLTDTTRGATETAPATESLIAGTVTGLNGQPVANATVTVANGVSYAAPTNDAGQYRISVPAGTYTVTVSAPAYAAKSVSNVSPSAAGQTNVALDFNGAVLSGTVRRAHFNTPVSNGRVVLVNDSGLIVDETRSNALGEYSVTAPAAGTYRIGALETPNKIVSETIFGGNTLVTLGAGEMATQNISVSFPLNADFEIPRGDYAAPDGWDGYFWSPTRQFPWPEWRYSTEQNHTPGGHYSIAFVNQVGQNSWNVSSGLTSSEFSLVNGNFNRTFSLWIYFTAVGQKARMRLSVLDAGGASLSAYTGSVELTATADMVGKWNEVTKTVPADPAIALIEPFAEATGGGGTVYFDDFIVTETPVAVALGKVVNSSGQPVENAFVGQLIAPSGFGDPTVLAGPVSTTDEQGNFSLFLPQAGEVTVAAWDYPRPGADWMLPDWGYIAGTATVNASPNPTTRPTLTLSRGVNVADEGTATAQNASGGNITGNIANALDNMLNTRWDNYGGTAVEGQATITFDLGSVQTVDQVEIWWEFAAPADYIVTVGETAGGFGNEVLNSPNALNLGITADLTPFSDGPVHVIKVPDSAKNNVRYITLETNAFRSGIGNYSITELRALNSTLPIPLARTDVEAILRIAGGLAAASAADVARLDQNSDGRITIADAVILNRELNGL